MFKEVEFGIVYNPVLDQLWTARKGMGAFYNGKKVCFTFFDWLLLILLVKDSCFRLHRPQQIFADPRVV